MADNIIRQSQLITTYGPGAMIDLPGLLDHCLRPSGLVPPAAGEGGRAASCSPSCDGCWMSPRLNSGRRLATRRTPAGRARRRAHLPDLVHRQGSQASRPATRSGAVADWCDGTTWTGAGSATKTASASRWCRCGSYAAAGAATSTIWTGAGSSTRAGGRVSARSGWRNAARARTSATPFGVCGCGEERSLYEASSPGTGALGHCEGKRPWIGQFAREACGEPYRLLVRTASNAYFPQTMSVISLPEFDSGLAVKVSAHYDRLKAADDLGALQNF